MQRNRKKKATSRSCIEINGGERETLHRYLVRSTITNAPSGLFKRHTRNKSTGAPTETTSSFLLQNLPKKARKIEEKEENPMMVFPMRQILARKLSELRLRQTAIRREERERERETREELGYGPCAHSNALSLLLLLNDLIFYLPRTSNGDHIIIYHGRQCTEIRHVSIRLDITSPSIQSSFLCPHTTGPTGHLPGCSKSSLPTCNSNRRQQITRFEDRTG